MIIPVLVKGQPSEELPVYVYTVLYANNPNKLIYVYFYDGHRILNIFRYSMKLRMGCMLGMETKKDH